ncbi:hypothetical protein [Flavitalea sp.]|nr:hypothetical protein [Flavitalea sp.]
MASTEQLFISLCKKQIEEKFSLGNGSSLKQRDLEILSVQIQEQTGVLISLSTLKRLWKNDYKQSPQVATLNALASVLGHKDWQSFRLANAKRIAINDIATEAVSDSKMPGWTIPPWLFLVIGVFIFGIYSKFLNQSGYPNNKKPIKVTGPINFQAVKTVVSGIPNTVIFKYDVSNVIADSFYIQQSWNRDHREKIDPAGKDASSIYFESGFHRAKLIANDSIIATQPIHIISNGWEPHLYLSDSDPELIDMKNENFIGNGQLHLDSKMLARRNINFAKRFHTRITNSKLFGIHSDNFSFSTRIRIDSLSHKLCAWMDVIIITDVQTFMVSLTETGCERNAAYKLGEILKKGKENDLAAFGCKIYDWHEVEIRVKDRHAAIYLNGKRIAEEVYKENLGNIVALTYIFDGTGSIDYSRLRDGNGKIIFEDQFGN